MGERHTVRRRQSGVAAASAGGGGPGRRRGQGGRGTGSGERGGGGYQPPSEMMTLSTPRTLLGQKTGAAEKGSFGGGGAIYFHLFQSLFLRGGGGEGDFLGRAVFGRGSLYSGGGGWHFIGEGGELLPLKGLGGVARCSEPQLLSPMHDLLFSLRFRIKEIANPRGKRVRPLPSITNSLPSLAAERKVRATVPCHAGHKVRIWPPGEGTEGVVGPTAVGAGGGDGRIQDIHVNHSSNFVTQK